MSRLTPQPDYAALNIQEFLEWIPKNCINGTNGPSAAPNRSFMPLPDLRAYLKAESRTSKLLDAHFYDRDHQVIVEVLEKWYIRMFTILILIGRGRYIEHFVQHHNLRDPHLPFLEKPAHFPTDPADPSFWERFYEKQFTFCAHYFRYNETYTMLEECCILPIISKEVLGQGGSAAIYKIKLHSHYDQLNPVDEVSRPYEARPANTYVLKTYNTKDADSYYKNEVDAFKKLATKNRIDQNLIQFLGSYKQGDTYNILLEYADRGTLEDFFQTAKPPSLGEDIVMFWGRLFNVIQALSRIHKTERPDGFRGPDILIGWHQDVKPSNVLVLSGKSSDLYDVEFKLGDLGLSHFKRVVKIDRKIVDSDVGGTKDYGAPECDRSDEFLEQSKLNVKPSIDIWSFGGVCSEAAVWVVLGIQGLVEYRDQRKQEICKKDTLQDGCCFHDGEKVLEAVEAMHDRLLKKGEVRPGDHVTIPIVDQMITSMLMEDPDGRQNAIWLWKRWLKISTEAQSKLKESNHQSTSREVSSMVQYMQNFSLNTQEAPLRDIHGAPVPYNGSSHPHGPPPNLLQYMSNPQTPGRLSSIKKTPTKRSDTWHDHSTKLDMTSGSVNGSPSPPIVTRQPLGASPSPETYPGFQEQADIYGTPSEESAIEDEDTLQAVNQLSHSPPNGLRPRLESNPQHSTIISPGEANQKSPPKTPPVLPKANRAVEETAPETSPQEIKPEKPYLSYKEARGIRETRFPLPRRSQDLLNDLKNRDHVFLIDDSLSMGNHWSDVMALFNELAYIAKRLDNNGLEMYFTVSEDKKTFRDTTPAVSHLRGMRQSTFSNIDMRLEQILRKYKKDLDRQNEPKKFFSRAHDVKPLSLYVFTDAAWQGCDAVAPVEAMIEKLRQLELPKEQIGIQFIRFGNDPNGIRRLEYLDSGLRKKYSKRWDIVDTEPFQDGNLLKMLLGAISNWFDDDDLD